MAWIQKLARMLSLGLRLWKLAHSIKIVYVIFIQWNKGYIEIQIIALHYAGDVVI